MFRERRNMNHRLAGIVVALVVVLGLLASAQTAPNASAPAGAATGKAVDKPSPKSRGAGPDPNIKQDQNQAATNAQETPAPLPKSGQKQRGPTDCWVTAANESPWYVNVYVDGTYRGQVSPWGKGIVNARAGSTTLYGRADFPNGSYNTWGPRSFYCGPDGSFTWTLHQ
jgi:hypothetical protein